MCLVTSNSIPPIHLFFFFVVFISALHPRFDFKFFSRRNEVKLEERICCQTHTSTYHLVWYFKPSRSEAGLRSLRDREGTKLAIDFLFFVVPSLDRWVRKCQLKSSLWAGRAVALLIFLLLCVLWWCLEKKKGAVVQPLGRLLLTVDTCSLRTKEREKRSYRRERGPSVHRNTPVNEKKEEKKGGGWWRRRIEGGISVVEVYTDETVRPPPSSLPWQKIFPTNTVKRIRKTSKRAPTIIHTLLPESSRAAAGSNWLKWKVEEEEQHVFADCQLPHSRQED